ncbi:hypothetical protein D3C81_1872470 [compost metagenome]
MVHGSGIGRVHLSFAAGDEPNMHCASLDDTFTQPEKHPTVGTKALQIGMARWPVLAVIVQSRSYPKRRHGCIIELD